MLQRYTLNMCNRHNLHVTVVFTHVCNVCTQICKRRNIFLLVFVLHERNIKQERETPDSLHVSNLRFCKFLLL